MLLSHILTSVLRLSAKLIVALLLANASIVFGAQNTSEILLRNASLILTMDSNLGEGPLGILEYHDILISGDSIVAIGKQLETKESMVIDASGKIIMPGFVSLHDHLFQAVMRGCGDEENIYGWLERCIYSLYGDLINEEDAYAGVRFGALEVINSGITTVADWSSAFSPDFVRGNLRGLEDSGLRFALAYKVTRATPDVLEDIAVVKKLIDKNPLASLQLSPVPSTEEPLFTAVKSMAAMARNLDLQLHIHLHEGIDDRKQGQLESLIKSGALGPRLLAAHAVHLTTEEIELLADNDVRLAHCPVSNMRTGSGIMPLPELLDAGLIVGLGVDGGAVSSGGNMFEVMRSAIGLQRVSSGKADATPNTIQVLLMATMEGAKALGMADQIGSLSPGKRADLIVLDPETVNLMPQVDWIKQIVFYGQPRNVEAVIINGRFVKKDGRLLANDIEDVQRAAQRVANKLAPYIE